MTSKSAKFETLQTFSFLFTLACERIFIKTHSPKSRCVVGLENVPGKSVHLSTRRFYTLGYSEGVKAKTGIYSYNYLVCVLRD